MATRRSLYTIRRATRPAKRHTRTPPHPPPRHPGDAVSAPHPPTCAGPRPCGATADSPIKDRARRHHTGGSLSVSEHAETHSPASWQHHLQDHDGTSGELTDAAPPELGGPTDYSRWPFPARGMDPDAARLYDAARSARIGGTTPPRLEHTTDLVITEWLAEATDHPQDAMVLQGIRYGFSIQYSGPPIHIDKCVTKETEKGALSGPYLEPPFTPWFSASPLMLREKSGGDGRRVIVDLSFPEGASTASYRRMCSTDRRLTTTYLPSRRRSIPSRAPALEMSPWRSLTSPGRIASSQWIPWTGHSLASTGGTAGHSTAAFHLAVRCRRLLCSG